MKRSVLTLLALAACGGDPLPPIATTAPSSSVAPPPATSAPPANDEPPVSPLVQAFRECRAGREDGVAEATKEIIARVKNGPIEDRAVVDALWDCFAAFRPSRAKSINLVKDLQAAVLAVKDPSYGPKAVALLARPVADPKDPALSMDEIQWWQVTGARLIGELAYTAGVRPLVTALVTPEKHDLRFIIRNALARMPKEAEPVLIETLTRATDASDIAGVAECIASIGRPGGKRAILDALGKASNDDVRAILAIYVPWFPIDPASEKAYRDAYAKIKPDATVTALAGRNARAALLDNAAYFFDAALVDWILREVGSAKGDAADEMVPSGLPAAIRLMTDANAATVDAAIKKQGTAARIEQQMWKRANAEVTACKKDVVCHLKELDQPVPTTGGPTSRMTHVKAAWMTGIYGDAKTAAALADKLATVTDGAVRVAILAAITRLLPSGDPEIAKKLEAIVEKDKAAGTRQTVDEMYRIALRLRARAL